MSSSSLISGVRALESRGLISSLTTPSLSSLFTSLSSLPSSSNPFSFYAGFDPTAPSLHVGHLAVISAMRVLAESGLRPIAVVGGATAGVGDPTGRKDERVHLRPEAVEVNSRLVGRQISGLLGREVLMVNNRDWLGSMDVVSFLVEVGSHFRVRSMLARDAVKDRFAAETHGLTLSELCYQTFQAYDFVHLSRTQNCVLQLGGNDQLGNILSGVTLAKRFANSEADTLFGITTPLLKDSSGAKLGKSSGNAVWLDPSRTAPFAFYQYFATRPDDQVEQLLLAFTDMPVDQVTEVVREHSKAPEKRLGQAQLADRVTRWVHGVEEANRAVRLTQALFGRDSIASLEREDLQGVPHGAVPSATFSSTDSFMIDAALVESGLAPSKAEARRLVKQGGVTVNGKKMQQGELEVKDLLFGSFAIVKAGAKNVALIRCEKKL